MSAIADLRFSFAAHGADGTVQLAYEPAPLRWAPAVLKRESVSLTGATFTALSPPTGSKLAIILIPATATSVSLKSVTGDGGTSVVPASGFAGFPIVLPLGATPSVGFLNSGSTVVAEVIWL